MAESIVAADCIRHAYSNRISAPLVASIALIQSGHGG
jgi:hypothetical protein